jgi:hypothetical protein
VFAPTDAAFTAVDASLLEGQWVDTDALIDALLYHVAGGELAPAVVAGSAFVTIINGAGVNVVVINGGVVLNGSVSVTQVDLKASNVVVHVLGAVLFPLGLSDCCEWSGAARCGDTQCIEAVVQFDPSCADDFDAWCAACVRGDDGLEGLVRSSVGGPCGCGT